MVTATIAVEQRSVIHRCHKLQRYLPLLHNALLSTVAMSFSVIMMRAIARCDANCSTVVP